MSEMAELEKSIRFALVNCLCKDVQFTGIKADIAGLLTTSLMEALLEPGLGRLIIEWLGDNGIYTESDANFLKRLKQKLASDKRME